MKIVVLAGGLSPERYVSLSSSFLICEALLERGHEAVLVDLFLGLPDLGETKQLFTDYKLKNKENYQVDDTQRTIEEIKKLRQEESPALFGPNVLKACHEADIVFLGLHGEDGENGKVQATLETQGIKYTGTDYLSSALAMDKKMTKILLENGGILTPKYWVLHSANEWTQYQTRCTYPVVIKPSNGGSSIGVTIAKNEEEANSGILTAFHYSDEVVVESYISGREFSVGFLGDTILPAIEIVPKVGFYDYKNKYQAGMAEEICPAELDTAASQKLAELTKEVKDLLKLSVYGRIDFLMDNEGLFYCIEANSLPGMTPTSLLPMEAEAVNISYQDLCEKVIALSLEKK